MESSLVFERAFIEDIFYFPIAVVPDGAVAVESRIAHHEDDSLPFCESYLSCGSDDMVEKLVHPDIVEWDRVTIDTRSEEEDIVFWIVAHLFYQALSQIVLAEFIFGFYIFGMTLARIGTVWLLGNHASEEDIWVLNIWIGFDDITMIENHSLGIGLFESDSWRKYFFVLDEFTDSTTLHEDIFFRVRLKTNFLGDKLIFIIDEIEGIGKKEWISFWENFSFYLEGYGFILFVGHHISGVALFFIRSWVLIENLVDIDTLSGRKIKKSILWRITAFTDIWLDEGVGKVSIFFPEDFAIGFPCSILNREKVDLESGTIKLDERASLALDESTIGKRRISPSSIRISFRAWAKLVDKIVEFVIVFDKRIYIRNLSFPEDIEWFVIESVGLITGHLLRNTYCMRSERNKKENKNGEKKPLHNTL